MDETSSQTIRTEGSTFSGSQTFSLELNHYQNSTQRTYPSVSDYYEASKSEEGMPIQLQPGLSNYSGLKLGDDRITFGESILSATYRIPVEHLMSIDAPSKSQTKHSRKREYQAAISKVGETELNRLERVMKDKLFQRSYATSSPFQVRKAFKFFDRENTLKIPIEGFTRALEFLGFQFAELQNLALFARYDLDYCGEIDYMIFISSAMFYAAVEPDFGQVANATPTSLPTTVKDDKEAKRLQLAEVKKVFDKVDKDKK
jgi:Ca2+-binding EF-hand superfamily protein